MRKFFEKVWDEYLAEKCAAIETDEERELIKRIAERRHLLDELTTKEQKDALEGYAEALMNAQAFESKKAFIKGFSFAMSFIYESEVI